MHFQSAVKNLRFQGVPALLQLHALDVAAALVLEQLLGLPLDLLLRLYDLHQGRLESRGFFEKKPIL